MATNPNLEGDGTALYIHSLAAAAECQNHTPGKGPARRVQHRIFQRFHLTDAILNRTQF